MYWNTIGLSIAKHQRGTNLKGDTVSWTELLQPKDLNLNPDFLDSAYSLTKDDVFNCEHVAD